MVVITHKVKAGDLLTCAIYNLGTILSATDDPFLDTKNDSGDCPVNVDLRYTNVCNPSSA